MLVRNLKKDLGGALLIAFSVAMLGMMFSGTASAQLSDRKTMVTFSGPVEIPDAGAQVLPAGSYVFKLVDSKTDRNIVQILSKDESHVYATILAIPDFRLKATDKTVMTFAERAAGEPQALRAWFYPGELWGQQFVYPRTKAVELAKSANLPVPYIPDAVAATIAAAPATPVAKAAQPAIVALRTVPVMALKPTGEVVQIAEVFEAPPPQAVQTTPALPKTASNVPLLALMGFFFASVGIWLPKLCAR